MTTHIFLNIVSPCQRHFLRPIRKVAKVHTLQFHLHLFNNLWGGNCITELCFNKALNFKHFFKVSHYLLGHVSKSWSSSGASVCLNGLLNRDEFKYMFGLGFFFGCCLFVCFFVSWNRDLFCNSIHSFSVSPAKCLRIIAI